jgi:Transposase DDE domain
VKAGKTPEAREKKPAKNRQKDTDSSSREPQSSVIAGAGERNRRKSRVRARIEHVFGAQQNSPGGRIVRTIGIARAKAKIGLQNLAYNIRRLVTLERMAAA